MKADDGFIYWVDVDENEEFIEPFDKISPNQNFYITEEGKLVISFDNMKSDRDTWEFRSLRFQPK